MALVKRMHRTLTVGYSICNPKDTFNEDLGIKIAKSRIKHGKDCGTLETNNVTMLTKDLIMCELKGKLAYITSHIDDYISKNKD